MVYNLTLVKKKAFIMDHQKYIKLICASVKVSAESARYNAGMSGSWGDGGASDMESRLKHWLDGVNFALTGKTELYHHIIDKFEAENDPEYQKYLQLKEKFEKKLS
jgi:hypothetical protein